MKRFVIALLVSFIYLALGAIMDKICFGSTMKEAVMTITAYAPLDPQAKKGRDYWGDPTKAADESDVIIGITCASGPNIPFGKWILIEGLGIYRVNDRGQDVKNNMIDITMETLKEARKFGKQKRKVWYVK